MLYILILSCRKRFKYFRYWRAFYINMRFGWIRDAKFYTVFSRRLTYTHARAPGRLTKHTTRPIYPTLLLYMYVY